MGSPSEETIRLDTLREPPMVLRYAVHRDERARHYGREDGVPISVGDVLVLDNFKRFVKVTCIVNEHTITVRPYPNEEEARADDAIMAASLKEQRSHLPYADSVDSIPVAAELIAKDDGLYVRLRQPPREALIPLHSIAPLVSKLIDDVWIALRAGASPPSLGPSRSHE
jgi:hypothetical protein